MLPSELQNQRTQAQHRRRSIASLCIHLREPGWPPEGPNLSPQLHREQLLRVTLRLKLPLHLRLSPQEVATSYKSSLCTTAPLCKTHPERQESTGRQRLMRLFCSVPKGSAHPGTQPDPWNPGSLTSKK